MQISRITKVRNKGKDFIRIFGYNENGEPVRLLKEFDNYVWMLEENIQKVTQKHQVEDKDYVPYNYNVCFDKFKKVILKNNKFTISKDLHKLSYNDDISPETKYILENKLQFSRKRHIAFFDIETYYNSESPDDNSCEKAQAPITSIAFFSNVLQKYFTLTWHPMKEIPNDEQFYTYEQGDNNIYICDNQGVMLRIFCQMINDFNIDIITGWYSHGYDVPYIMKRLQKKFGSYDMISPIGNAWLGNKRDMDDYYKIRINGLDSVDLMQVVQSLNYNLQNNKLDTAAEEILGSQFMKIKQATWRDWQDNFDGFMKYVVRDVEILKMIDDKLKCFQYLIQMQILSSIPMINDIMSVTRLIDAMLIKKFWDKLIFPNTTQRPRQNFMGGRTIDPTEPGVHRNVAVFDYASLYPTTIMAYNISPETFLFSKASIGEEQFNKQLKFLQDNNIHYVDTQDSEELFGDRYIFMSHDQHVGIIPELSLELYKMRKYYKKLIKTATTDDERLVADKKQYAIKIILNSIYGAMGFRYFRLYVPECADAVTFFGRKALRFGQRLISDCGTVLYQDTDSIFLKVKTEREKLNEWLNNFNNNQLMNLIKQCNPYINPEYFQYNLEHQKDLDYLYLGDRKKRYYSIQKNGKKYIHGLNIIKKDTPKFIKELLDKVCQESVKETLSLKFLEEVFESLKTANYEDIAVHKSFSKKFQSYNKTIPQHVSGALFANKYLDLKIRHSDVVFLFYINSFCEPHIKPQDRKNVICLRSQDFGVIGSTDKFQIDTIQLFEKQIVQPLREFDKISVVKKAIEQWCSGHPENYRLSKNGEYKFKKKTV